MSLSFPEGYIHGRSAAMLGLHEQLLPLAAGNAPALLLGETGVGKELIANALHASSRPGGPFVAVNCAAIPGELLEAEMFGIARGVATGVVERPGYFQLAKGGTIFLDEIGELPLGLQAKLLRALQGGEIQPLGGAPIRVDARVIAATNSDLDQRMERGSFRRDLYYRIAAFVLRVPSLRERADDIPGLVHAFLCAFSREAGRPTPGITPDALGALGAHAWRGNVRELRHEVQRLVYLCPEGQAIDRSMLSPLILDTARTETSGPPSSLRLDANIDDLERRLIRAALARCGGRRAPAARLLGISRNGLALKIERLGIGIDEAGATATGDRP